MTKDEFNAVLGAIPTDTNDDGWAVPPGERHLTLYVAHDGVPLTVGKVAAIRLEQDLVHAQTRKGELYLVGLTDVFAIAADAPPTQGRKAGFAVKR